MLPEALAQVRETAAAGLCPGFTSFAGQRPRAQRSLASDLIFGSLYQDKEQSPPAAIERADIQSVNTASWKQERAEIATLRQQLKIGGLQAIKSKSRSDTRFGFEY